MFKISAGILRNGGVEHRGLDRPDLLLEAGASPFGENPFGSRPRNAYAFADPLRREPLKAALMNGVAVQGFTSGRNVSWSTLMQSNRTAKLNKIGRC
ncbi:MAG: hypothetical protein RLZZ106_162 [Cyanobacteriota bacterium]